MNPRDFASLGLALAGLATSLLTACACAQPTGSHDRPPPPPAEALAACQSAASGATCSFSTPRGQITGSCWAPVGKPLACRPKDAPTGHSNAPGQ